MSNFREMAQVSTIVSCLKNIRLLECEQIIHRFEVRDLEIPNEKYIISIKSRNLNILRKNYIFGISRSRALK